MTLASLWSVRAIRNLPLKRPDWNRTRKNGLWICRRCRTNYHLPDFSTLVRRGRWIDWLTDKPKLILWLERLSLAKLAIWFTIACFLASGIFAICAFHLHFYGSFRLFRQCEMFLLRWRSVQLGGRWWTVDGTRPLVSQLRLSQASQGAKIHSESPGKL